MRGKYPSSCTGGNREERLCGGGGGGGGQRRNVLGGALGGLGSVFDATMAPCG